MPSSSECVLLRSNADHNGPICMALSHAGVTGACHQALGQCFAKHLVQPDGLVDAIQLDEYAGDYADECALLNASLCASEGLQLVL